MSGHDIMSIYEWLLFQIRSTVTIRDHKCGMVYMPVDPDETWPPTLICLLKINHPDGCQEANERYSFDPRKAADVPLVHLYGIAYAITDHGFGSCGRVCALEVQINRLKMAGVLNDR